MLAKLCRPSETSCRRKPAASAKAAAAEAFGGRGLWFADKDPLIQVLLHDLPEHAHVLVKGSRFMKMEEVVQALQGAEK